MINFFRKIRKQLASENKFGKYLRYAFGEILLVVIGILIALQVNNWNEKRKKEAQFKNTLEQLYNKITDDSWYYSSSLSEIDNIIHVVDNLLSFNDGQDIDTIPGLLWYTTIGKKDYQPKALPLLSNLDHNLDDTKQDKLANQLSDYNQLIKTKFLEKVDLQTKLSEFLLEHNLAFPKFDINNIQRGLIADSTYYTSRDLQNVLAILKNENFRTLLKTLRTKLSYNYLDFKTLEEESTAILGRIKAYYPNVKLLFEDVGIIGTSINGFNDVGAHSTPMVLIDEDKSIWEIDLYLKKGLVKFRCRDSWAINWGGTEFPIGTPMPDGPNIYVTQAGTYKIILNLTDYTYEFIKRD